jgi:hypothetical protein
MNEKGLIQEDLEFARQFRQVVAVLSVSHRESKAASLNLSNPKPNAPKYMTLISKLCRMPSYNFVGWGSLRCAESG